jgi:hypothetical protein
MKGSIVILRNIEDVFDFVTQPENLFDTKRKGWIMFDSVGPVSAGSRLNASFTMGPIAGGATYEVTTFERPYRLGFLITSQGARITGFDKPTKDFSSRSVSPMQDTIELKAAPGGTRLTRTVDVKSKNPVAWMLALPFSPFANWGARRDLRRLKTLIESELP